MRSARARRNSTALLGLGAWITPVKVSLFWKGFTCSVRRIKGSLGDMRSSWAVWKSSSLTL